MKPEERAFREFIAVDAEIGPFSDWLEEKGRQEEAEELRFPCNPHGPQRLRYGHRYGGDGGYGG